MDDIWESKNGKNRGNRRTKTSFTPKRFEHNPNIFPETHAVIYIHPKRKMLGTEDFTSGSQNNHYQRKLKKTVHLHLLKKGSQIHTQTYTH